MKLFVTDIDETLSLGESVSDEVKEACLRLKNSGWDIMIATGRTFGTAKNHIKAASATQPAIVYDGSRIMGLNGEEISSSLLDASDVSKLLDAIWDMPFEIQIAGDEEIYCRESDGETVRFYSQAGVPVHFIDAPRAVAPMYRIGLWIKPEKLPAVENEMVKLFGDVFEITSGGESFLDILPKGVSKGSALERFVSGLPKRPDIIVAAGDHNNDLAMLRYADFAAAPGNASPPVLSAADIVIPRAGEHGLCLLIDHILSPEFRVRRNRGGCL
ncbi:MAG: Cof-type HAD-IIB family hydrolase [Synergistaceae bacterium]|nr:Cof-type HAD-IIB family hydrolase [Synergistaceae bacterium]